MSHSHNRMQTVWYKFSATRIWDFGSQPTTTQPAHQMCTVLADNFFQMWGQCHQLAKDEKSCISKMLLVCK